MRPDADRESLAHAHANSDAHAITDIDTKSDRVTVADSNANTVTDVDTESDCITECVTNPFVYVVSIADPWCFHTESDTDATSRNTNSDANYPESDSDIANTDCNSNTDCGNSNADIKCFTDYASDQPIDSYER